MNQELDPKTYGAFLQTQRHLPAMPSREEWLTKGPLSTGELVQRLWETAEVQTVHIHKLEQRIATLESQP